jgi:hypothetical protein
MLKQLYGWLASINMYYKFVSQVPLDGKKKISKFDPEKRLLFIILQDVLQIYLIIYKFNKFIKNKIFKMLFNI